VDNLILGYNFIDSVTTFPFFPPFWVNSLVSPPPGGWLFLSLKQVL